MSRQHLYVNGAREFDYRYLNEWIEEINDGIEDRRAVLYPYLCECGDPRCQEQLTITRGEYEAVRSGPCRFLLTTRHENPGVDAIIESTSRFTVTEKFGVIDRLMAYASDPRRTASLGDPRFPRSRRGHV
jgi:hypothetical protein